MKAKGKGQRAKVKDLVAVPCLSHFYLLPFYFCLFFILSILSILFESAFFV
jgi:hypothetical protein